MRRQDTLGIASAVLVANPVPEAEQLDPGLHERALAQALVAAGEEGVTGQRLTPYLLAALATATEGGSLEANLAAVRGNVRLGAQIAIAFSSGA